MARTNFSGPVVSDAGFQTTGVVTAGGSTQPIAGGISAAGATLPRHLFRFRPTDDHRAAGLAVSQHHRLLVRHSRLHQLDRRDNLGRRHHGHLRRLLCTAASEAAPAKSWRAITPSDTRQSPGWLPGHLRWRRWQCRAGRRRQCRRHLHRAAGRHLHSVRGQTGQRHQHHGHLAGGVILMPGLGIRLWNPPGKGIGVENPMTSPT